MRRPSTSLPTSTQAYRKLGAHLRAIEKQPVRCCFNCGMLNYPTRGDQIIVKGREIRHLRRVGEAMPAADSREENCIHITSPIPDALRSRLPSNGGGPGTFLTIKASMQIASEPLIKAAKESEQQQQRDVRSSRFILSPRGTLRVLVVDDQRTMRQMVAMLFQKLCTQFPDTKVSFWVNLFCMLFCVPASNI